MDRGIAQVVKAYAGAEGADEVEAEGAAKRPKVTKPADKYEEDCSARVMPTFKKTTSLERWVENGHEYLSSYPSSMVDFPQTNLTLESSTGEWLTGP